MKRPTRVQVYEGLYRSQADELFRADAAEAARHGWHAVEEGRWNGEQLAVTFVLDPSRKASVPVATPSAKTGSGSAKAPRSRARRVVAGFVQVLVLVALVATVFVGLIGVALIADVGNLREMAKDMPKPIPHLVRDYLDWVKSIRG